MKPAAVELHATLDLLEESLSKVTLTADTASERAALPKASSLGGCLLMADRGYFDRDYLLELTKAGASFVIRAPKGLNPKVLEAFDAQDRRIPKFVGKPLKTLRFVKRGAVESARALEGPGSVPRMPPHRHMEFLDPGVSILGHQPPARALLRL